MRKNIIAGNWKMNKDLSEAVKLVSYNEFKEILVSLHKDAVRMNSRGTSGEYRTKTYNVFLINSSNKKIPLKIFPKKTQAEEFKKEMIAMLNS